MWVSDGCTDRWVEAGWRHEGQVGTGTEGCSQAQVSMEVGRWIMDGWEDGWLGGS